MLRTFRAFRMLSLSLFEPFCVEILDISVSTCDFIPRHFKLLSGGLARVLVDSDLFSFLPRSITWNFFRVYYHSILGKPV